MKKPISQQYQNWKNAITQIYNLTNTEHGFIGAIGTNSYRKNSLVYLVKGGYIIKTPIGHGQHNFKWNIEKTFSDSVIDYVCTEYAQYKRATRKDKNNFKTSREASLKLQDKLKQLFDYLQFCKCKDKLEQEYILHIKQEIEDLL